MRATQATLSPWADLIPPSSDATNSATQRLDRRVKPADGEVDGAKLNALSLQSRVRFCGILETHLKFTIIKVYRRCIVLYMISDVCEKEIVGKHLQKPGRCPVCRRLQGRRVYSLRIEINQRLPSCIQAIRRNDASQFSKAKGRQN